MGFLAYEAPSAVPCPEVRDRLMARVKTLTGGAQPQTPSAVTEVSKDRAQFLFVHDRATPWQEIDLSGIEIKPLFSDPVRQLATKVVRLRAGAQYPNHRHMQAEHVYMIDGDFHVAGHKLTAGQYHHAPAGTDHGITYTDGGCLLLLRGPYQDQPAAHPSQPARASEFLFVDPAQKPWEEIGIEGVSVKWLYVDPVQQHGVTLVRMAASAQLPSHQHTDVEEFYMLEGDGHVAGEVLLAGDYQRSAAGSIHGITYTEKGCMFITFSSLQDRPLE